jgi:hemolysin activation/secretion protein
MQKRNKEVWYCLCGLAFFLYSAYSWGAISVGPINPARSAAAVSEELNQQQEGGVPPQTAVVTKTDQTLPPEVAKLSFNLQGFNVLYNHSCPIFSKQELIQPFVGKIGKKVTLGEVQAMANQMATRYQQAGYILTRVIIPPQQIETGVVTLQVIEGYIDKVEIKGNIAPCIEDMLREYGEQIRCSRPLNMKVLERYTLLASDIHGLKLKAVLKPSASASGAADLVFVVEQKYGNAFVAVNNFGTRYLGPLQLMSGVEWDSSVVAGDVNQFQVATTADKEMNFAEFRHAEWLNCDGLKGSIFGQVSHTQPGSILRPFDIVGNYDLISADISYPIIRSRKENMIVSTGCSMLDSQSKLFGKEIYFDHIRPVFLGLLYNNQDKYKGVNQAELIIKQGLHIFGASGHTNISRPNGHSNFTLLSGTLQRTQMISDRITFYSMIEGQYAFRKLLVPMQFGFGGSVVGRGYDPSEIIGNQGVAGTLEARLQVPRFSCHAQVETYVFYDAGKVWNPGFHDSATSTGAGIRAHIFKGGELMFYVAKPLTHDVVAYRDKRLRAFFSLVLRDN